MISELKNKIPLSFLGIHFGVSRSGYYSWLKRRKKKNSRVDLIKAEIISIFKMSYGTYGSPRMHQELISRNFSVSENTVAKYMKELGLDARLKKKFRVKTTDSNHDYPIADRVFKAEESLPNKPFEVVAGDITYLRLGHTFLYLAVVIDLFNREVVGWSMSRSLQASLVVEAMNMALKKGDKNTKFIFHSDRGSQYASEIFRNLLESRELIPSMSRKGNCYDNCYVETWFKSLKSEWIYRHDYSSENELRALVFEYIETWYNTKRRHSSLDYLSPKEYKKRNQLTA
jgi:transposase InsO family protein